jgi:hypothetical protein
MTEEVKHTPGPWKVYMATTGFHVIGIGKASDGQGITDGGFGVWGGGDAESLANARLLAAAPDLLEALSELVEVLRKEAPGTALNNHRFDALGIKANDAIRKAAVG